MDTVFGTSSSIANNENKNILAARKPGHSTRVPLADRSHRHHSAPTVLQEVEDAFPFDTCSHKEVPDTYNDLMGPAELCRFSSINLAALQKTPPPKRRNFDQFKRELIRDINRFNFKFNLDTTFPDAKHFQICDFEDDAPLPDLDFKF